MKMDNRMNKDVKCYEIYIKGIVQGVGFRPFVYNLAVAMGLKGWVNNIGAAVAIDIEGEQQTLESFVHRLKSEAPPLSLIREITVSVKPFKGYTDFTIEQSSESGDQTIYMSPDVSICPDCRRELLDSGDRRYLYPFINCTNCGPRFTIITGIPYDREKTTMKKFRMCEKCASEYNNPTDRRYHAQPVSCYDCGPRLELLNSKGDKVEVRDLISHTRWLLSKGHIVAIKGLGGYHLACDALNGEAVRELRKRKIRDDKPFAIMAKDYDTALHFCYIGEEEKRLLESEKKPIVLLRKRENAELPEEIAPGNPNLGIMLPYTPVHVLLLEGIAPFSSDVPNNEQKELSAIVLTSGNRSSEPIYYRDGEAFENLKDIADFFLTNDRDIFIRTDDSVTRVFMGGEYIIRRSRGYVPMPVTCDTGIDKVPSVLACGGELKNTFCLNKGNDFYLSHHIGDLENAETLASFEEGIEHFKSMFTIKPEIIAYDLHPEYLSTKYALDLDIECKIPVQHHHAHIASCMAENNLKDEVIGVAFDGTGFGEDGHLWGGEFFTGGYSGFCRVGHLDYVKMPGGDMAIKEPWRMTVSYLYSIYPELSGKLGEITGVDLNGVKLLADVDRSKIAAVIQMLDRNLNSPLTSSMGRLFDAVSALVGLRSIIRYEGQAAIELEHLAEKSGQDYYSFAIRKENGCYKICVQDLFKGIMEDMGAGIAKSRISSKFHETVACMIHEVCCQIRRECNLDRVVLSGGVFQNTTLLEKSILKLEKSGFKTYIHSKVPSNDGGISLGQGVIAAARVQR